MGRSWWDDCSNLYKTCKFKNINVGKMLSTWEIENYTGTGKLTGFELSEKMFNHTQELEVEYRYGDVEDIVDKGEYKEVHTTSGDVYETKAVIIASGTNPRLTGAPG